MQPNNEIEIKEFYEADVPAVKIFADINIGQGYYSLEELYDSQKKSVSQDGDISSFVLIEKKSKLIKGLRLSYPPGHWSQGKGEKLRPDLWPFSLSEAAYFQSLFIAKELQQQGWGSKLSLKSIEVFKKMKANGIITHAWKESPNNSSVRYLEKIGFNKIIEHPLYWFDIDYVCTRDGKPCRCTAIEMYLDLMKESI